jgi:hypothetical protein
MERFFVIQKCSSNYDCPNDVYPPTDRSKLLFVQREPRLQNQKRRYSISCTLTMKYWKVSPLVNINW